METTELIPLLLGAQEGRRVASDWYMEDGWTRAGAPRPRDPEAAVAGLWRLVLPSRELFAALVERGWRLDVLLGPDGGLPSEPGAALGLLWWLCGADSMRALGYRFAARMVPLWSRVFPDDQRCALALAEMEEWLRHAHRLERRPEEPAVAMLARVADGAAAAHGKHAGARAAARRGAPAKAVAAWDAEAAEAAAQSVLDACYAVSMPWEWRQTLPAARRAAERAWSRVREVSAEVRAAVAAAQAEGVAAQRVGQVVTTVRYLLEVGPSGPSGSA